MASLHTIYCRGQPEDALKFILISPTEEELPLESLTYFQQAICSIMRKVYGKSLQSPVPLQLQRPLTAAMSHQQGLDLDLVLICYKRDQQQ